jgi:PKD domain/PASTA domain
VSKRTLLAGAVLALALPAAASADTFCVKESGCPADHTFPTIGGAVSAAALNGIGTPDTIEVGPGTYPEQLSLSVGDPLTIVGSGDATNIAPVNSAANQDVINIREPQTSISAVKITMPQAAGDTGVAVDQNIGATGPTFSHVDVVDQTGTNGGTGLSLYGSKFSDGIVNLSNVNSTAAVITDSSVTRSSITAGEGIEAATNHAARTSVTNSVVNCYVGNCSTITDDGSLSLVLADDLLEPVGPNADGVFVVGGNQTVTLDQSTLLGGGTANRAVAAINNQQNTDTLVNIDGAVIRGFGEDLVASGNPAMSATATINVKYSDFDPAKVSVSPTGNPPVASVNETVSGSDLHNVDPRLNTDGSLQSGSPAIDKGDPAQPVAGEPSTDVAGHPRKVDGDHSGTATIDMGAFELQPPNHAPLAAFRAPGTATTGRPVAFDGSASHDPDHDPITYAWRFGDGTTATGPKPRHAYRKPGRYTVQLVVTDDFGAASAPVKKTIVVAKPVSCIVPKLRGKSLATAKRALKRAHCGVGKVTRKRSSSVRSGHVIGSKPKAGRHRPRGTRVALLVSR